MMIDVLSSGFRYPLIVGGLFAVWALSKTGFSLRPIRDYEVKPSQVVYSLLLVVASIAADWLFELNVPVAPENFRLTNTVVVVSSVLFQIVPVLLITRWFGGSFSSVRLTSNRWLFSLALGGAASLILLAPTMVFAPSFLERLPKADFSFYISEAAGAFGQELLFRGLLQSRFEGFLGINRGVTLTALVFNLAHAPRMIIIEGITPTLSLASVFLNLPLSLLLGYIAQRSNNLLGSTLYHISLLLPLSLLAS